MNPRPYQTKAAVKALILKRVYLAFDMGLGKTLTTLLILKNLKTGRGKGVLIFAPLRTLTTTWPEENLKWGFNFTLTVLHGPQKSKALGTPSDLYLINPEGIKWLYNELIRWQKLGLTPPFDTIVIDEGSMWKSSKSLRFKYLSAFRSVFPEYRIILSGTPAPNGLLDLWAQYFILDDGKSLGTNFERFRSKYFKSSPYNPFVYKPKKGSKQAIYELIREQTIRLDAKDYLTLPSVIYNDIEVQFSSRLKKAYDSLEKDFLVELESIKITAVSAATLSMKLRQFVQGALYTNDPETPGTYEVVHKLKVQALKSLVEESGGQGILCAIQFKFDIQMIQQAFPGINIPVIAGGTSPKNATKYIQQWNAGDLPLLLCHPQSLGHGVNLQTGSHIILWYGIPWSLEQYQQLNARIYRQGQTKTTIIHHLVMLETMDIKIKKVLRHKHLTQQELLDYLRQSSL